MQQGVHAAEVQMHEPWIVHGIDKAFVLWKKKNMFNLRPIFFEEWGGGLMLGLQSTHSVIMSEFVLNVNIFLLPHCGSVWVKPSCEPLLNAASVVSKHSTFIHKSLKQFV